MKKALIAIITFAAFLSLPFPVHTTDVKGIEIGNGIYRAEKVRQEDASTTAAGYKSAKTNVIFLQKTDRIAAVVGTSF